MTQENLESARSSIKVTVNAKGQHQIEVKIYVDGERITDEAHADNVMQQTLVNVKQGIIDNGGEIAGS